MSLTGKICLVTGASRGMGKGIAVQLGEAGATVYVTGRTLKAAPGESTYGTLEDTAKEIEKRGGRCIPVKVDHTKDDQIENLFKQISREQNGKLDLLVNNAFAAVSAIIHNVGTPFYEHKMDMFDLVTDVGLRNHYICTIHASRMMIPRKSGLIVNVSSPAGLRYLFNVAYGIGKQALDRMAVDCALELRPHNIAMVSLWPASASTEVVTNELLADDYQMKPYYQPGFGMVDTKKLQASFKEGESMEFAGKAIVCLAKDPKIMDKSGRILLTPELSFEYGFRDIDNRRIPSTRSLKYLVNANGYKTLAKLIPEFIRLPFFVINQAGSKF